MKTCAGDEYHHKVRQFQKNAGANQNDESLFHEVDGFVSMKVFDYFSYLEKRANGQCDDETFSYTPFNGKHPVTIKPRQTGLYLIDFDLEKLLPRCHDDFINSFSLPGLLPGGENCMMNSVSVSLFYY